MGECVLNRWLLWLVCNVILRHVYLPMLQTQPNMEIQPYTHAEQINACWRCLDGRQFLVAFDGFLLAQGFGMCVYSFTILCNIICVIFSLYYVHYLHAGFDFLSRSGHVGIDSNELKILFRNMSNAFSIFINLESYEIMRITKHMST